MELFRHDLLCKLNKSEFLVYDYISSHLCDAAKMNIRELALACGVSTTTVLRFCSKLGCENFREFKYRLAKYLEGPGDENVCFSSAEPAIQCLQYMEQSEEIRVKMEQWAELCMQSKQVLFAGNGTSRSLGEYGSCLLSGAGIMSFVVGEPEYFMAVNRIDMENLLLVVLSISGESPQMISLADTVRRNQGKIISITNTNSCTIAQMSEINFSYYMSLSYSLPENNSLKRVTQLPVIYLLERMQQEIERKKRDLWQEKG